MTALFCSFRLMPPAPSASQTATLTIVAMIAFAANSLTCRLALAPGAIDAATFATIRMVSGAITLGAIMALRRAPIIPLQTHWRAAAALFTYMIFFSFAYLSLGAGTGAL